MPSPTLADLATLVGPLLHAEPADLELAGAVRTPTAGAPRVRRSTDALPAGSWPATGAPDDAVHPVSAALWAMPADTFVSDLTDAFGPEWSDEFGGAGSGSVALYADDVDLPAVTYGDVVRFSLYGDAAFAVVVEAIDEVTLDTGGEAREVVTVGGRGVAALAEEVIIYPANGVGSVPIERDRLFGWQSPDYDVSSWPAAIPLTPGTIRAIADNFPTVGLVSPVFAAGWPNSTQLTTQGIWSRPQTLPGPDVGNGTTLFRSPIVTTTAGNFIVVVVMDDFGELWLDGVPLETFPYGKNNFQYVKLVPITLSAGPHGFAASTTTAWPGIAGGLTQDIGIFALDVFTVGENNEPGVQAFPGFATDADWKALGYPVTEPGVTAGGVVLQVLAENAARGGPSILTPTFTATVDSAGQPWDTIGQVSTKTGTDLLTFLGELGVTYVDWWVAPGDLSLWLWNKGGRGATRPVALTVSTGDPDVGSLVAIEDRRT